MTSISLHRPGLSNNVPLSKRLLFPGKDSSELPPLLSCPTTPELTAELYDFIALALRGFINPWWTKITRYDKEFLPEICRILTRVIRVLEERVVDTDLSPLIFQDIPTLLTQHYSDYRNVQAKLATSYASGGSLSLPQLFHQLQPHMALTHDGKIEPEYFRQIVDHILKTCLPPEDYAPETERFIVREIILKVILNDVIPKITQPWFIHKMLLDQLIPKSEHIPITSKETVRAATQPISIHSMLVIFLSAIQTFSGACLALIHAYKQIVNAIKQSQPGTKQQIPQSTSPSMSPSISAMSSTSSNTSTFIQVPELHNNELIQLPTTGYIQPSLMMISEIFSTSDRFASSVVMSSVNMTSVSINGLLDRKVMHLLLPYFLNTALSHNTLTTIVRTSKRTLFPNGYPGSAPPDPTLEEQAETRKHLIEWSPPGALSRLVPILLGHSTSSTIADALEPLSSAPCNVHLVIMILDRILLNLFPELAAERKG